MVIGIEINVLSVLFCGRSLTSTAHYPTLVLTPILWSRSCLCVHFMGEDVKVKGSKLHVLHRPASQCQSWCRSPDGQKPEAGVLCVASCELCALGTSSPGRDGHAEYVPRTWCEPRQRCIGRSVGEPSRKQVHFQVRWEELPGGDTTSESWGVWCQKHIENIGRARSCFLGSRHNHRLSKRTWSMPFDSVISLTTKGWEKHAQKGLSEILFWVREK